jgi:biopolymer transport protein ExbB/TolQ
VTKQRESSAVLKALGGLGWPLILGLSACSLFYVAIFRGPLNFPVMHRYFTGHPVPYFEAVLFFVGLAALALKFGSVIAQAFGLSADPIEPAREVDQDEGHVEPLAEVPGLLQQISAAPRSVRDSYLGRRVHDALAHVQRQGTAEKLDDELKYLSDRDIERQHNSFALVRIVIWATPMLGFLGTVMGIAKALGNLDPTQLATDPAEAMQGLLSGLYVAFDTTAVALVLSIVLMFLQFLVERVEGELLAAVDERAMGLLEGRFPSSPHSTDPLLGSIERMCYTVMRGVENLVERQAVLWHESMDRSQQHWRGQIVEAGEQLQSHLQESLGSCLAQHAERLGELHGESSRRADESWNSWQKALDENSRLIVAQQETMLRQGEILSRTMEVTGDVVQLERSLNANLQTLADSRNFEDTMLTLSAAIQLLSSRLGGSREVRKVDLSQPPATQSERAA